MAAPETFYRRAIDLNRYSNRVAADLVVEYERVILRAARRLRTIDETKAPWTTQRLRALLRQFNDSINSWPPDAVKRITRELQGLAELSAESTARGIREALPTGPDAPIRVRTVEVDPAYAERVVTGDPTRLNVSPLSTDLSRAVGNFDLTARRGTLVVLPNGSTIEKTFRGIAQASAERFSQATRSGLIAGDTNEQIYRRLVGRMLFNEAAKPGSAAWRTAGGEATKVAAHQIESLVRTSINQVNTNAAEAVLLANQDITDRYVYLATLDGRTTSICAALDQQVFKHDPSNPKPPQHFGCRSTIAPFLEDDDVTEGYRAAKGGRVRGGTSYGEWLQQNPAVKQEVLGSRAPYFDKLAKRYGPREAIRKFVRTDGSQLTLEDLRRRYGEPG